MSFFVPTISADDSCLQPQHLRIALLAGTLGLGGAEKQLVYVARALRDAGVDIRIFSLTQGEHYESILQQEGLTPRWIGRVSNRLIRLIISTYVAWKFRPHVYQSGHFFANGYVSLLSSLAPGTVSVGSIRGDTLHDVESNRIWGRRLLHAPNVLISNTYSAKQNAIALGVKEQRLFVLPNVIDLEAFSREASLPIDIVPDSNSIIAVAVARLVGVKRIDRLLHSLALARSRCSNLIGWIIGDGPERARLEVLAEELGLLPDGVLFWGTRDKIPAMLAKSHILVLTSDREGFPNVILEAMAASLPVITTSVGDTSLVVEDGVTGYVVPLEGPEQIADRLICLTKNPEHRVALGAAGRCRVEQHYSYVNLAPNLLSIYGNIIRNNAKSR